MVEHLVVTLLVVFSYLSCVKAYRVDKKDREPNHVKSIELLIINDNHLFVNRYKSSVSSMKSYNDQLVKRANNYFKELDARIVIKNTINWTEIPGKLNLTSLIMNKSSTIETLHSRFNIDYFVNQKEFNHKFYDAIVFLTGLIIPSPDYFDSDYKHTHAIGVTGFGSICSGINTMTIMAGNEEDQRFNWDVGSIMTHELGHMLGLNHVDKLDCGCNDSCVMKPNIGKGFDHWSACSLRKLEGLLQSWPCLDDVGIAADTPADGIGVTTHTMAGKKDNGVKTSTRASVWPGKDHRGDGATGGGAKKVFPLTIIILIMISFCNKL